MNKSQIGWIKTVFSITIEAGIISINSDWKGTGYFKEETVPWRIRNYPAGEKRMRKKKQ